MSTKKKSIFGDLFKKKDCGCGVKIVPEESKETKNSNKKKEKTK